MAATAISRPLRLPVSGRVAPNRILKAALTERLATWDLADPSKRGIPTHELDQLYRTWALGNFGMVLTGNIMVDNMNLETAGNMIVTIQDGFFGPRFEAFKRLAEAGKGSGLFVGQISHAGRQVKAVIQPDPVSASDIQLLTNDLNVQCNRPHAASLQEIGEITAAFAHAAEFLDQAGFDGVQIHGAHGYLLSQFLSRSTNKRSDQYGTATMEDRARLIIDIVAAIRARTRPDFVVGVKINTVDWEEDGFQPSDAEEVCKILDESSFDFIELSGGSYVKFGFSHQRESTRRREAFFLDFAERIVKPSRRTPVFVTGGFRSTDAMAEALKTLDGVGVGRPAGQEPLLGQALLLQGQRSAAKLAVDPDNFGLTATICGAQMRQISEGKTPFDATDLSAVGHFMKQVGEYMREKANDHAMLLYKPIAVAETIPNPS